MLVGEAVYKYLLWSDSLVFQARSNEDCTVAPQGIFGVPLQVSIRYANVAISLFNEEGQSYIYGYVPIVVAKCGVYLKEKGELASSFRLHYSPS